MDQRVGLIAASMPSGVEHGLFKAPDGTVTFLIAASMPSGVEHPFKIPTIDEFRD